MVATTFAADTPLVVTGLVYAQGISGNWLWWGSLLSGMMTVFLFARLWRRSGLLTDVQFAEIRYSGRPAAFLRGFRAVYLGLLMNCVILGWVTKAMTSIVAVTLGGTPLLLTVGRWVAPLGGVWAGPDGAALAVCVLFLIPFTGLYVSLGGLWGVLWTDLFQFVLKMSIVIAIAFYAVRAVGGMSTLLARLSSMRSPATGNPLAFFPNLSRRTHHRNALDHPRRHLPGQHRHCSGGPSGIPAPNPVAEATSPSASSAPATSARACSVSSGSTSPTTPSVPGRGSSPPSPSSSSTPALPIRKPASCWS